MTFDTETFAQRLPAPVAGVPARRDPRRARAAPRPAHDLARHRRRARTGPTTIRPTGSGNASPTPINRSDRSTRPTRPSPASSRSRAFPTTTRCSGRHRSPAAPRRSPSPGTLAATARASPTRSTTRPADRAVAAPALDDGRRRVRCRRRRRTPHSPRRSSTPGTTAMTRRSSRPTDRSPDRGDPSDADQPRVRSLELAVVEQRRDVERVDVGVHVGVVGRHDRRRPRRRGTAADVRRSWC